MSFPPFFSATPPPLDEGTHATADEDDIGEFTDYITSVSAVPSDTSVISDSGSTRYFVPVAMCHEHSSVFTPDVSSSAASTLNNTIPSINTASSFSCHPQLFELNHASASDKDDDDDDDDDEAGWSEFGVAAVAPSSNGPVSVSALDTTDTDDFVIKSSADYVDTFHMGRSDDDDDNVDDGDENIDNNVKTWNDMVADNIAFPGLTVDNVSDTSSGSGRIHQQASIMSDSALADVLTCSGSDVSVDSAVDDDKLNSCEQCSSHLMTRGPVVLHSESNENNLYNSEKFSTFASARECVKSNSDVLTSKIDTELSCHSNVDDQEHGSKDDEDEFSEFAAVPIAVMSAVVDPASDLEHTTTIDTASVSLAAEDTAFALPVEIIPSSSLSETPCPLLPVADQPETDILNQSDVTAYNNDPTPDSEVVNHFETFQQPEPDTVDSNGFNAFGTLTTYNEPDNEFDDFKEASVTGIKLSDSVHKSIAIQKNSDDQSVKAGALASEMGVFPEEAASDDFDDFEEFKTATDTISGEPVGDAIHDEWAAFDDKALSAVEADDWAAFQESQTSQQPQIELNTQQLQQQPALPAVVFTNSPTQSTILSTFNTCFPQVIAESTEGPASDVTSLYNLLVDKQAVSELLGNGAKCSQTDGGVSVWNNLKIMENTAALKYQWLGSRSNDLLLKAVNVDTRNILTSHRKPSAPVFAASLGLLEPKKATSDQQLNASLIPCTSQGPVWRPDITHRPGLMPDVKRQEKELLDVLQLSDTGRAQNAVIVGTGATSTVSKTRSTSLDTILKAITSSSSNSSAIPTSTLVRKIDGTSEPLSAEASAVLARLPDLSFMHAKVLMFPVSDCAN